MLLDVAYRGQVAGSVQVEMVRYVWIEEQLEHREKHNKKSKHLFKNGKVEVYVRHPFQRKHLQITSVPC